MGEWDPAVCVPPYGAAPRAFIQPLAACGRLYLHTMPIGSGGSNKSQKEVVNKKKKKKDDDDDDDEGSLAQKNKMKEDAAKVKAMQDKLGKKK